MELSTINNGKHHEENSGFKTEHTLSPDEENRRAEAIATIFHTETNNHHHDFFERAADGGTNVDNNKLLNVPDDLSTMKPNMDNRSEFGGIAESIPDINIYQHKKTLAQGMMDMALFSANANQLRYVLESVNHPYYYSGIVLITISLIFQVAVGVGLLINTSDWNISSYGDKCIHFRIRCGYKWRRGWRRTGVN
ncbi:hypothetical protein Trydic_g22675 [Trypoxylus dichotomus]